MISLLIALSVVNGAPRCAPEGLYQAQGFVTRFDGQGHWQTSLTADQAPVLQGRYVIEGERIRFKLERDPETSYGWSASYSEDCATLVLDGSHTAAIHFQRVTQKNR